ncbi:uncharacterized protein ISCGN_006684 [Ixodes scapularis]
MQACTRRAIAADGSGTLQGAVALERLTLRVNTDHVSTTQPPQVLLKGTTAVRAKKEVCLQCSAPKPTLIILSVWWNPSCGLCVWSGVPLMMVVDTGSPVSVIPQDVYLKFRSSWPRLRKTSVRLSCFLGTLPVLGELNMRVKYEGKITDGTLIVLGCSGPSLRGRDLIRDMNARGAPVLSLSGGPPQDSVQPTVVSSDDRSLELLLEEFTDLFEPGLGTVKGPPRKIESILGDLPGVQVYLDDILVAEKKGDSTLRQVLLRLRDYGVRLNKEKCKFRQKESVWFRKYSPGEKWSPGVVKSTSGSRLVEVQSPDVANIHRRHADQLRSRDSGDKAPGTSVPPPGTPGSSPTGRPHYRASGDPAARTTSTTPGPAEPTPGPPVTTTSAPSGPVTAPGPAEATPGPPVTTTSAPSEPVPASGGAPAAAGSTPRRSSRTRRPPSRLVYKDRGVQGSE